MRRSIVTETDDDVIVSRAAAGDREAFGRLYERYQLRVYRHAQYLTNDHALAEDVTSQTFLKALEAIPRFEHRGAPFVAWLLRIACNLVINYRKSPRNSGHSQLTEAIEANDITCMPDLSCEVKLDGKPVWDEVRKLPTEQQRVIIMRFVFDLGYPEIARALGKSVGAVRVTHFRALNNLRTHMLEGGATNGWITHRVATAARTPVAAAARQ